MQQEPGRRGGKPGLKVAELQQVKRRRLVKIALKAARDDERIGETWWGRCTIGGEICGLMLDYDVDSLAWRGQFV